MRLEQWKAFVAVAETGSFSYAGEQLFFSQSTVSRYIADLEKELGDSLLERSTRTCELTSLGKSVLPHAQNILREQESIMDLARLYRQKNGAVLKIGYAYRGMLNIITRALAEQTLSSQGADLTMRYGTGVKITKLIREGFLNCGIMHLPSITSPEDLQIRLISECKMYAMLPEEHFLARQDTLTLEQLSRETEVCIRTEKSFYRAEDEAFLKLNLTPIRRVYVDNSEECYPVMMYNRYICFTPSVYQAWLGCRLIPITDWSTGFPLVFVTRKKDRSRTVDEFYRTMCDTLRQAPAE